MKRDMDLVRKILFAMEAEEKRITYSESHPVKIDGYRQDKVAYHMKIMGQAGLLHMELQEMLRNPQIEVELPKVYSSFYSLSWAGHEFLDAARDDQRWEKAKNSMAKAGGFALDVMKQLLIQYLKTELKLS